MEHRRKINNHVGRKYSFRSVIDGDDSINRVVGNTYILNVYTFLIVHLTLTFQSFQFSVSITTQ